MAVIPTRTGAQNENQPTVRSRIPPANNGAASRGTLLRNTPPQNSSSNNSAGSDWMKSGTAARAAAESELARQQEAAARRASGLYMPFRFWIGVGKSAELVILDSQLGPFFYEHGLKDAAGKYNIFESCPKEFEPCPLCAGAHGAKESYYVMMLTVADLTPYRKSDGTVVQFSRKLLPVKAGGQGFFVRQFDRHGSLRGMRLLMNRDTATSASIGTPEFIEIHSEQDILDSFGGPAVTDKDGKVIKQANADAFAFDYGKLFKRPSAEDLRKRYGGAAPMGSRQEYDETWNHNEPAQDQGTDTNAAPPDDDIPY